MHLSATLTAPASPPAPAIDASAPLLFVINASSGQGDGEATREVIDAALARAGRRGEFYAAGPGELAAVARKAAAAAVARQGAIVAVGGDGTTNTVAQAAHALGCAMGVIARGTFNYFARAHGLPTDAGEAVQALLDAVPAAVQVGLVNDHVFLVNASLGLYPQVLQDREAYKARFGRSRAVALGSVVLTLLRGGYRQLRLRMEAGAAVREVRTPMLFVGNNRLQLERLGLPHAPALEAGCMAGVVLRPVGPLAMIGLLLRGAVGMLGHAETVESFEFRRMTVAPRLGYRGRRMKVAYDGEVGWMRGPLEFRVAERPLYLLVPAAQGAAAAA